MKAQLQTLLVFSLLFCLGKANAQRLQFSIDNGVSIPLGLYGHPDFYFQGGEAAGVGYNGQVELSYHIFSQLGISALLGLQTNPYRTSQIQSFYRDKTEGMLIEFDQRGYLVRYAAIGPRIKLRGHGFFFAGTIAIGRAQIQENFIRIDFENRISKTDAFMSSVVESSGAIMAVKGLIAKELNENMAIGISVNHIRGAFAEVKSYFFYRDNNELEQNIVYDKVQPSSINLALSFHYRFE